MKDDKWPSDNFNNRLKNCNDVKELITLFNRICINSEYESVTISYNEYVNFRRSDGPYFTYEERKDEMEEDIDNFKEYHYHKKRGNLKRWYLNVLNYPEILKIYSSSKNEDAVDILTMHGVMRNVKLKKALKKIEIKGV